ncbi:hypothetical protein BSL78_04924 [Apostichopus japonicus]|uniref:Uncharacterized protein n=1 Tax=Stichopus japonicus TaxID=307972 RepID=A0A2G8LDG2_STIJA|nr:hypothetical protein BSL78_04924 [Apostichopus japonicus]
MEKKRRREGFRTQPTLASLLVAYMLRYALVGAVNSGKVADQNNSSNVGSSTNSDQELPVCADINPSPAPDKVLILWAHLKLPNCGVQAEDELISVSPVGAIGGYLMDNIVSDKQYNISIKCIGGEVKKSGAVHFRIDDQYSSSPCTSANWLEQEGANKLTICNNKLRSKTLLISYNATIPLEDCYLKEFPMQGEMIKKPIHVLPFTISINQSASSMNSSFSVECYHPQFKKLYTAGPVISDEGKQLCATKNMIVKGTDNGGATSKTKVHQSFVTYHVGLFVVFIVATIVCSVAGTIFLTRRLRLHRRRQGQRLLVNEDGDEAAFREYREMES